MDISRTVLLASLTTFRIGGNASFFTTIKSHGDLFDVFNFIDKEHIPFLILGGGSNVLVSDQGFSGIVIQIQNKGVIFEKQGDHVFVKAQAGEVWDELVSLCVSKDLWGIENLSYIPGTVGAAPVQNIGAYGVELKDVLESVSVFDTQERKIKILSSDECELGYRDSIFKKSNRFIVLEVVLRLSTIPKPNISYKDVQFFFEKNKNNNPTLQEIRNAVIEIRKNKLPDWHTIGTAGSFFKNPIISKIHYEELLKKYPELPCFVVDSSQVKIPLAWILDKVCGLKGFREGSVGLYEKQPLALVNFGNAKSEDVKCFAEKISNRVKEKTNIDIEWEVQYVENRI